MCKLVLLFLFPIFLSANIWDNLYEGQGVPFELPIDFAATISFPNTSNELQFNIFSSTGTNMLSINTTTNIETPSGMTTVVLSQTKFSFKYGTIFIYSKERGCKEYHFKGSKKRFYYTLEGLLDLSLLLNSQDTSGIYKKVDITPMLKPTNISKCINDIALYFLDDQTLKLFQTKLMNEALITIKFDNIRGQRMPGEEFWPPESWKCPSMMAEGNSSDNSLSDKYNLQKYDDDDDYEEQGDNDNQSSENEIDEITLVKEVLNDMIIQHVILPGLAKKDIEGASQIIDALKQLYQAFFKCE